jgi:Amt family ammonium transporter
MNERAKLEPVLGFVIIL